MFECLSSEEHRTWRQNASKLQLSDERAKRAILMGSYLREQLLRAKKRNPTWPMGERVALNKFKINIYLYYVVKAKR